MSFCATVPEAREVAREHEEASRRAPAARAREFERSNDLTQSRKAIEHSMASGDLDTALRELQRADESYDPGAEFADLRAHVLELRRDAELRQDRLADEVIDQVWASGRPVTPCALPTASLSAIRGDDPR